MGEILDAREVAVAGETAAPGLSVDGGRERRGLDVERRPGGRLQLRVVVADETGLVIGLRPRTGTGPDEGDGHHPGQDQTGPPPQGRTLAHRADLTWPERDV